MKPSSKPSPVAVSAPPLLAEGALDRDRAEEIASIFHLLGEPNRLSILAACMTGPRSVNDLANLTGMSASLTSHHLRLLKAARLVRARRQGKFVHYSVHDHHVTSVLLDMMEHVAEPEHEQGHEHGHAHDHDRDAGPATDGEA